jgi:hypothetical protein
MSKKKSEKSEKPRFYGKKTSFLAPCPSALGLFQSHGCMQYLLRKYIKNELKTVLNKTSPLAHTESEFDMLGVPGKLGKYVVHLFKRKN